MSSEPFNIGLIVERLRSLTPVPLSFLGTIVEYSQVTELSGFAVPGAYVLMGPERGVPGKGCRAQVAEATFGVAVAVRNYSPGADGLTHEISPLIGQIRDQLIGWIPGKLSTTGIQWVKGDILDYDGSTLLWMDTFQVNHIIGGKR
ncbi:phage tail terminator protein [Citrobacter braakii]|uniref:phage tail terminator protein n=1 Tax=Citrobacter braakii TaxID=57706 RepID=UPI0039759A6F